MTKEEAEYLKQFKEAEDTELTIEYAKTLLSGRKCRNCYHMMKYENKLYCNFDASAATPFYAAKTGKEVTNNHACMLWIEK